MPIYEYAGTWYVYMTVSSGNTAGIPADAVTRKLRHCQLSRMLCFLEPLSRSGLFVFLDKYL